MNGNRNFFFAIAIRIPILILELGFHESTTELGQLLISVPGIFEREFTACLKNATSYSKDNTSPTQYPLELILLSL